MLSAGLRNRRRGIRNRRRDAAGKEYFTAKKRSSFVTIQFHPAELSGPSNDPRLQLMMLPREIRDKILRLVMVTPHEIRLDSSCNFLPLESPPEIAPALLSVCKQAYYEARPMLYRENKWLVTHMKAFAELFIKQDPPLFDKQLPDTLGENRATLLRDLVIYPGPRVDDDPYPREPEMKIHQVTRFVFTKLPALQHLRLMWHGEIDKYGDDSARFLREAAYITSQHPILKKAIWNGKSGKARTPPPWDNTCEVAMAIDFVAAGHFKPSFNLTEYQIRGDSFSSQILGVTEKDLILNCLKIRKAAWGKVSLRKLEDFALPDTASSSEPY